MKTRRSRCWNLFGMGVLLLLALAECRTTCHSQIVINEVLATNTRSYPDITDFEDYPDWIELKNTTSTDQGMTGCFLSDEVSNPYKWPVPSMLIGPNALRLVMADGHNTEPYNTFPRGYWPWDTFRTEKYHTNFKLSAEGETLSLTKVTGAAPVTLVQSCLRPPFTFEPGAVWKYFDLGTDPGYGWRAREYDDAAWPAGPARLGYNVSQTTTVSFGSNSGSKYPATYFRHAFNLADPSKCHRLTLTFLVDDGCVFYLNGAEIHRVNMDPGAPTYQSLANTEVAYLAPPAYRSITIPTSFLQAGDNVLAAEVHQVSVASADLYFDAGLTADMHQSATLLDSVVIPRQVPDISYGRDPRNAAAWVQFAEPTPGKENNTAVVHDVRVRGAAVTASLPGGYYLSNQTVELSAGGAEIRYTTDGSHPGSAAALYTGPIPVTQSVVVRARSFAPGKAPGPILTQTYLRGTKPPVLPWIGLVADPETLFGNTIGIYTNQHEKATASPTERNVYKNKDAPGHIEFFHPGGGGFRANCGIRIGSENNWVHAQKPLNIAVDSKWGDDQVDYDLFPGSGVGVHNAFALREGGDNWLGDMLRDAIFARLAAGRMALDTADYRPAEVYLNARYHGIHEVRQRWDDAWFAQKHHVSPGNVDHLKYGYITGTSVTLGVDKGSTAEWLELTSYAAKTDLTIDANLQFIESRVDFDSLMDFVIAESYGNNIAVVHNREFWKEKKPGAKWRWFLADFDRTFSSYQLTGVLGTVMYYDTLLAGLKKNLGFRERLAQRYAAHMAGTFSTARVQSITATMDAEVKNSYPQHAARWFPLAVSQKIAERNTRIQEIKDYAALRTANFSEEVASYLGVGTAVNFTLGISHEGRGTVKVLGLPVPASTFKMFPAIPFTLEAVPAPGFVFTGWTGAEGGPLLSVTLDGARSLTANFEPSSAPVLGGTLAGDTVLPAETPECFLSQDLIIPSGVALTIPAGVTVRIPPGGNIRVQGVLKVDGTSGMPVSFVGIQGGKWGGISFENPSGPSSLTHVLIRGATKGVDPVQYPAAISGLNATLTLDFLDIDGSEGPVFARGGSTTLRDSRLHNPFTGDCLNVKQGQAVTQRCVFLGNNAPDTDAIDYDGVVNGLIEDCRIHRFQGGNSDGVDVGEGCVNVLIQGNLIYYNSDKGFSVGQGSSVVLRRNLVVGCNLGVGIKDSGSFALIDQNSFISCVTGVALYEKNLGDGGGSATITNNIFSHSSPSPVTSDAFSSYTAAYNLSDTLPIPGTNNWTGDPLFVNQAELNFQLQAGSPAINAGDPSHAPDPDSSVVDIGAQYVHMAGNYPYTIGETIVVNEVLANSGAATDWIELHNRTNASMNIGGWFLSDSAAVPAKYRIPPGTVIPAGGYLTFTESQHFGLASVDPNKIVAFALSDVGETVYLTSAVADEITDYQSQEDFGPSLEGESLGTYYKPSSDSWNFVAMRTPTPGARNSGPRVGPIVISEIMYRPAADPDAEYIELLNVSAAPVTLYDSVKGKAWRISDGIDFEFPAVGQLTMAPGERVVLARSLVRFNAMFGGILPAGTKVYEWITGGLSNGGETLQLDRPGAVDATNVLQYVRTDRVAFDDALPWPTGADGGGSSLTKISESDYGNDYVNWMAAAPSPGRAAPGESFAAWAGVHAVSGAAGDADGDGLNNLLEYAFGTNPNTASAHDFPVLGINGGQLQVSFEIDSTRSDLNYQLEVSNNLTDWTALDTTPVSFAAGLQTRTWQDTAAPRPSRFYRVKVNPKP